MSVLESIGAAMPGLGFALGGLIAAVLSPRMTFLVAGAGVLAIVVVMAPLLGGNWPKRDEMGHEPLLDGRDDVVVELLPGLQKPGNPDSEGIF
jgi:hypothetical protein